MAFACFLGVLPCSGVSQVSESARQCFEWFGTLGYPDFKEARWAEVWTGNWVIKDGGMPARTSVPAFVIGETGEEFTVVDPSLVQSTLRKTAEGTPSDKRIDFEERLFRPFIEERIEKLRRKNETIYTVSGSSKLDLKSETFVMAYVCWVKGEPGLAGELYALAEGLPLRVAGREENKPMREALELGLGYMEMWRTVLECGGDTFGWSFWDRRTSSLKPREELAAAFRRIEQLFPASPHAGKAAEMAALLERMVEEDREHPAIPPDEWDDLPQDRRIAELVWRLRDQNGHQSSQPGWCSVFGNGGDSSAQQLLNIGYPAVPALIEALTDQRLSRSVGYHRNFYFSHSVLTVGDCAQQILDRITGRSFYTPASTSSYMAKESKAASVQEQARAWWAEFESKGKKQMLIDAIASGEIPPRPLVRQLNEEAPEAVADAVMRGAAAASEGHLLSQFISELGRLEGPEPIRFLKEVAEGHAEQSVRLQAARSLLELDVDSAVPVLLAEWKHFPPGKDETGGGSGHSNIVHLLVGSGDARAMRALFDGWESRSPAERFEIMEVLGEQTSPYTMGPSAFTPKEPIASETWAVAIELLVRALEDTAVPEGRSGIRNDYEYKDPQIGDFALWALNRIDEERFPFAPGTGRRLLDLQRIEAANRWRAQHGITPLPLPEPPGPVLPESAALKVAKVTVEPEKLAEAPLAARALGWKGKDLEEKALIELLRDYFNEPVASTMGLVVEVYRRSDLTGVEVALTFREGYAEESERWSMRCRGIAGELRTARANDNGMDRKAKIEAAWSTLEKVVQEVLSLPPTASFGFETSIHSSGGWPRF